MFRPVSGNTYKEWIAELGEGAWVWAKIGRFTDVLKSRVHRQLARTEKEADGLSHIPAH
jgi:hypothetical protein